MFFKYLFNAVLPEVGRGLSKFFRKPIAAMASISFSMYLTHIPLFLLFGALFPKQRATIGIFSLGGIVVFGVIFERNKIFLRRFFEAVLNYGRLICLR